MSAHPLFLLHLHERGATAGRRCFAPFANRGYGAFAFDLAPRQEQIPLNPPASKGEAKALPLVAEVSGQVGP
jgi:hypothetical protein